MPAHNLSLIFMKHKEIGRLKKMSFFQIHQFSIFRFEKVIKFKACKSGKIDSKDMNVAQLLWLSGSPEKGNFTTKSAFYGKWEVKQQTEK